MYGWLWFQLRWRVAIDSRGLKRKMSEARIQAMIQFRLTGLRALAQFRDDAVAHAQVELGVRQTFDLASKTGQTLFCEQGGEVLAGWLWWENEHPVFGVSVPEFILELDTENPDALRWVRDLLRSRRMQFPENTTAILSSRYAFLIPELSVAGLALDCIELLGDCAQGIAVLGAPLSHQPYGLVWRPLRSREDLFGVLELRRRVFEELPQYAWFAASTEHSRVFRDRIEKEMNDDHLWQVLVKHGEVLGFVGSSVVLENPFWGPRGGVELVLDAKLRGRGLGKEAYRRILKGLLEKGCPIYKGVTANPSVLHLAAQMGREMVGFHVRAGATLPQRHFALFVD